MITLHIGYPKSLSSSLQRTVFPESERLSFLGCGTDGELGYYDSNIENIFEVSLKTSKTYVWEQSKGDLRHSLHKTINNLIQLYPEKDIIFSSENICYGLSLDCLDFETKLARLQYLFEGFELRFLIILRNQWSLLKSLFKESIRMGYPFGFDVFIQEFFLYQDRNAFHDFNFHRCANCIRQFFQNSDLVFWQFEDLVSNGKLKVQENGNSIINNNLKSLFGIDTIETMLGHENPAESLPTLMKMSELNKTIRHGLGNSALSTPEKHRMKNWIESKLEIKLVEEEIYRDVLTKRKLLSLSRSEPCRKPNEETFFQCDKVIRDRILDFYRKENEIFMKKYNCALSSEYFFDNSLN